MNLGHVLLRGGQSLLGGFDGGGVAVVAGSAQGFAGSLDLLVRGVEGSVASRAAAGATSM
ncbi:hypothetical protein [Actinokineospora iranica]|uniref:hypothetical protein n=1 Tax=Actinokineospora iranica TaxID=1271860 RepID=UPI0011138CAC|nr:hypothetical protein [Actinokineospora iranica]